MDIKKVSVENLEIQEDRADSAEKRTAADTFYSLGFSAYSKRNFDEAEKHLIEAVDANPDNQAARNLLCNIYTIWLQENFDKNDYDAALENLKKAESYSHYQSNAESLMIMGYAYKNMYYITEEKEYLNKAKEKFEIALTLDPRDKNSIAGAFNGLGNLHFLDGNNDMAIKNYLEAIKIIPQYASAHHDLALAYEAKMKESNNEEWGHKAKEEWIKAVHYAEHDPAFSPDYITIILERIKHIANIAYQQSEGTPVEEIASDVNQAVQNWVIRDTEQMRQNMDNLIFSLKAKIPENQANRYIHERIEGIKEEKDLNKTISTLALLIASIPQTVIGGNMNGDIYTNVNITGNNNILGRNNVITINQQQLAKIPDEYAKSLQAFSEAVNNQLKKYNVSKEEATPVQESINELAKEVEGIKPEKKINLEKQEDIKYKIKKVAFKLREILPDVAETIATFTPLAPFSKIIGKGVEEIVKE